MIIYDDDGIGHDVVPRKVIDDIKAEIRQIEMCGMYTHSDLRNMILRIIDKHIGERSE